MTPLPPISELDFMMKPMFSIFTLAIKFNFVFLAIFQSFLSLVSFVFDKLAHPQEHMFQKML